MSHFKIDFLFLLTILGLVEGNSLVRGQRETLIQVNF